MPYTIHTARAAIKDAEGHFKRIDVFSDELETIKQQALSEIGQDDDSGARKAALDAIIGAKTKATNEINTLGNTITKIKLDGVTTSTEAADMIAEDFDPEKSYLAGTYVRKAIVTGSGSNQTTTVKLFKLMADYVADSGWDSASKEEVKVGDQLVDLKSAVANRFPDGLEASTGIKIASFIPGRYSTPDVGGASEKVDVDGWVCAMLPATADDYVELDGEGASSTSRLYAVLDASKNVLFRSAANTSGKKTPTMSNYSDAAYIVVNSKTTYAGKTYLFVGDTISTRLSAKQDALTVDTAPTEDSTNLVTSGGVYTKITEVENYTENEFATIKNEIQTNDEKIANAIGTYETTVSLVGNVGFYWNSETDTAVLTEYSSYKAYAAVSVNPFDQYHERGYEATSTKTNTVIIVDANYKILAQYGSRSGTVTDLYFSIPASGAYVLLSTGKNHILSLNKINYNNLSENSFNGCKFSLLGDSFSAFQGYSTDDHYYYPNPQNADVDNVNQMWWKLVADRFGMTPLVIGAWSGSPVTDGARSGWSGTVASDASRCEALDDGTNNPDVVLIAMGVNDYSYMEDASQFGTWDGTTALGSETDLSDYNNTTFKTAYATMIARIQKKYPDAFIICITPWFQKRRTTDTGTNYLNSIGKSITDYADAVREVCGIMHVSCIDGTNIGFNRRNYYPTYCQDTQVSSTHPNVAGQAQIAKAVIAQMRTLHRMGT